MERDNALLRTNEMQRPAIFILILFAGEIDAPGFGYTAWNGKLAMRAAICVYFADCEIVKLLEFSLQKKLKRARRKWRGPMFDLKRNALLDGDYFAFG
jgi:hypothetical protein